MPTGEIEPRQVERLREMGAWLRKNGESIYGIRGGPVPPMSWGVTTRKGSTVYVHVLSDTDDVIALPSLKASIQRASLIDGTSVEFASAGGGTVIRVPSQGRDPNDTVVVLKLDRTP